MADLNEIVLTRDKGFVLAQTQEPVDIIGGNTTLSRVVKSDATSKDIETGVRDVIERVYAEILPDGINGYILHTATPLNPREKMLAFSGVRYRERETSTPFNITPEGLMEILEIGTEFSGVVVDARIHPMDVSKRDELLQRMKPYREFFEAIVQDSVRELNTRHPMPDGSPRFDYQIPE